VVKRILVCYHFYTGTKGKEQSELNTKEREVKIEALGEVKIETFRDDEQSTFYSTLIVRMLELYKQKSENKT